MKLTKNINLLIDTVYLIDLKVNKKSQHEKCSLFLKTLIKRKRVNFSISHSENYVAFIYSKNKIGIDIEKRNAKNNWSEIAFKKFIDDEKSYGKNCIHKFYSLWVRKEAIFKAVNDPNKTMFDFYAKKNPVNINNECFYFNKYLFPGFAFATCSNVNSKFKLIKLNINDLYNS